MASAKEGTDFVNKLRGLDTSGVEVDEEQEAPTIAANSAEEKAALATMEAALDGTAAATAATSEDKLMCLRGRKYDPERAAALLPKFLELKADATLRSDTLYDDVRSRKVIALGTKDVAGRGVVWLRLRFHEPKKSKAADMCRFIAIVMLRALQDVDVQRTGMCVVQDMTGLKLSNLDPTTAKELFGRVFSSLPLRVGRILIFNPPWILGYVILPMVLTFMSKKLKSRIVVINGHHPEKLLPYIEAASLPTELKGSFAIDESKWTETLVAELQERA